MTAKEMKHSAKIKWEHAGILGYLFSEDRIKSFCEQLCKEQREKCALNIDQEAIYCGEEAIINRINNAPNPEI